MAGGIGARFWPMSRSNTPKQFIDILGDGSTLIQKTFSRFSKICPKENIYIVTSEQYKDIVKKQLPDVTDEQLVLEPARRNTAPCIHYANFKIRQKNPNAVVVVAPSDHLIVKEDVFLEVVEKGLKAVSENDCLLTIGIKPSRPETGYGYVEAKETIEGEICGVQAFKEKPNLETAEQYLKAGNYLWNAGIFVWNIETITECITKYKPNIAE